MNRKKTKQIMVGNVAIGGGAPIAIQSMTCTRTGDVKSTVAQIQKLEAAGCEIVRVAVPDAAAAAVLAEIKAAINLPLVADIHFDYRLAIESINQGVDKIRINPGNIGSTERVAEVLKAAVRGNIPVRIGVNGGSLDKKLLKKYGGVTAGALVESALEHIKFCEEQNFSNLIISVKSSNVGLMIEVNRLLSEKTSYPLHLGVTEAGSPGTGTIRSAVGIGTLLAEGIGDTIRVSLTGDPVAEIKAAKQILKSLDLRKEGVTLISCPTCGRTNSNLAEIVNIVEARLEKIEKSLTIAVMGCEVNGPGEAKEADIGVACGKNTALLFKKGIPLRKIKFHEIADAVFREVVEF